VTGGRWRISVSAPDWGQDHLSSDAIVAYVDDELADGPYLRATQHLAECRECAAQVVAQGQARAALRTADVPSLPSSLLSSLHSIPQDTDLPPAPPGLSVTSDGQLVSVLRPPAPPQAPAGRARPVTRRGPAPADHDRRPDRRLRLGTGVAVSGLAIGAIAFAVPTVAGGSADPVPTSANGVLGGSVLGGAPGAVDARLQFAPTAAPARRPEPDPVRPAAAPTPSGAVPVPTSVPGAPAPVPPDASSAPQTPGLGAP
jgi:hypothetical protein